MDKVLDGDDGALDGERLVGGHLHVEHLIGLSVGAHLGSGDRVVGEGRLDGLVATAAHVDLHLVEADAGLHRRIAGIVHVNVHRDVLPRSEALAADRGVHVHLARVQQDVLLRSRADGDLVRMKKKLEVKVTISAVMMMMINSTVSHNTYHQILLNGRLDDDLLDELLHLLANADGHLDKVLNESVSADHRRWQPLPGKKK